MVGQISHEGSNQIIYPDSDGQPMADNTKQFRWIMVIKENLELLFAEEEDVFVAGDLLWYPVEGSPTLRQAPDVMVVFGRPKGDRGSYKQWEENNIIPQVVFEILSPGNRLREIIRKFRFYENYGVEEYYIYDPDKVELEGWIRSNNILEVIEEMNNWISPRLGVRFELKDDSLELYRPDGEKFLTFVELAKLRKEDQKKAEEALRKLEQEKEKVKKLEARLRELGVELE
ncbi:protein of unknown function DUF820 [Gloeothece citriformis PCC 7424]|uniref:Putative restriction endonuclease domain-containing protein n=1 Tax=Gloeothece citriformis (strain PCC 7424) TaxID=65393 RepID=B7K933_GLOC7|nr:Uma2 family endonuclease [Gloeothece citriformis]ACK72802.1 protein of unknown function DUF820 [Gloeothece citriformis PCC 7424]